MRLPTLGAVVPGLRCWQRGTRNPGHEGPWPSKRTAGRVFQKLRLFARVCRVCTTEMLRIAKAASQ